MRSPSRAEGAVVGVLEVGGTHVTSALVDADSAALVGEARRRPLDSSAAADLLLAEFVAAMSAAHAPDGAPWAVAIPGPFDYTRGIGRFEDVGKFESLRDVDLGSRLRAELSGLTGELSFLNDADAYAIGEWRQGVTSGAERCAAITLGTGVGSAFLDQGVPVTEGPRVPPEGRLHRLRIGERALEDVVSRRAILAAYAGAGPAAATGHDPDVADVVELARRGDAPAARVLDEAFVALGSALGPWLRDFGATMLAVGGGMAASWDVVAPSLRQGLSTTARDVELLPSDDTERATLVGAATGGRRRPAKLRT